AAFDDGAIRAAEVAQRSRWLGDLKRGFARWQAVQNGVIEALMGLGALAVLTAGARLVADGQLVRTALPLATLLAASSFQPVVTIVTVVKELTQTLWRRDDSSLSRMSRSRCRTVRLPCLKLLRRLRSASMERCSP